MNDKPLDHEDELYVVEFTDGRLAGLYASKQEIADAYDRDERPVEIDRDGILRRDGEAFGTVRSLHIVGHSLTSCRVFVPGWHEAKAAAKAAADRRRAELLANPLRMTRAEYAAEHPDFKGEIDGRPAVTYYDGQHGTCLGFVEFID